MEIYFNSDEEAREPQSYLSYQRQDRKHISSKILHELRTEFHETCVENEMRK